MILDFFRENLQTTLTVIIACIATYIAYQQHVTNRNKLKLDLFDRRLKVYYSMRNYLVMIQRDARVHADELMNLRRDLIGADFLFGKDATKFNEAIIDKSIALLTTQDVLSDQSQVSSDERSLALKEKRSLIEFLVNASAQAHSIYKPYIEFSHIR